MKGSNIIDFRRVSEHYILSLVKYIDGKICFTDYYSWPICIALKEMKLDFLEINLPHPNYTDGMRKWMVNVVAGPDKWIYAGMYSYNNIVRFRPTKNGVEVEDLSSEIDELTKDKTLNFSFTKGAHVGLFLKG